MIRTPDWGETRRLQLVSPEAACETCGHMLAQHMQYDAEKVRHTTGCEWTTCGCPSFTVSEREETMTAGICGAGGNYGVHQEPLACAHPKGHDGPHAWESLPTFVNGQPVTDAIAAWVVDRYGDVWARWVSDDLYHQGSRTASLADVVKHYGPVQELAPARVIREVESAT